MAKAKKPTGPADNPAAASTVEDPGLAARLAALPAAPAPAAPAAAGNTLAKLFKFRIQNDYAGKFDGTLRGLTAADVRKHLVERLTAGISIEEVS